MRIKQRQFTDQPGYSPDFMKVQAFLKRIYEPHPNGNWYWYRWEWMFSSSYVDENALSRIGIWEDKGEIVAMANYEHRLGLVFYSLDKGYDFLKKDLLEYAISNLYEKLDGGKRKVKVSLFSPDGNFSENAQLLGFQKTEGVSQKSRLVISQTKTSYLLTTGFSVISLADENDPAKLANNLWKGFDHKDPLPDAHILGCIKHQSSPNYNKNIAIVVKAPNGEYVSHCGMWYDTSTDYAIIEPLATVPEYRKKGLGRIAAYEGVKRCEKLGAKIVYVGSGQQFYYSIGFKPFSENHWWSKEF